MSEPVSTTGIIAFIKIYIFPTIIILISSLAHAIQEVKKNGWKGSIFFFGDMIVAAASGSILFQFAMITMPSWAVLAGSLGGYLGPKGVNFVWQRFSNNQTK